MSDEYSQLDLFQSALKYSPKEVSSEIEETKPSNQKPLKTCSKFLVDFEPEFLVIPFPLNRRTKKIRYAATTFEARTTQEKKQRFWDQTVNQLVGQMSRYGIGDVEIEKQIIAFRHAVSDEIYHQNQNEERQS